MSEETISIEKLPLRESLEINDNILVESLENPSVPTSRTTLEEVKKLFSGEISERNENFVKGKDIHQQLEALKAATNNISSWKNGLSELCTMPLAEFIKLQFDCCLVQSTIPDFPADLQGSDTTAYVFTNRDEKNAVQILVGATSGIIATRRMNHSILTEWTYSNSKGISYATFSVKGRQLIMHTDPGYSGANFSIKNRNLIVTI